MKLKRKWLILIGAGAALVIVVAFSLNRSAQAQHFTAAVERGEIDDVVEATGTINAVITVQVGSQVSGTIAKLYVDFNSRVHKGDIVALIDPALFKGAVQQAQADLENAKANLIAARTNVEKAKASFVQTKADYDRTVELNKEGVMSQQQLDIAKANYDSANATVAGAVANVTQAGAQVSQKDAAVTIAQTNLNYTVIRSPIDGTVVARNVDVGQTVAASLQAPTVFTIAQDLSKMWVYAKTDESDVGNIKVGKPVTFKVDAFPKDTFHGVVAQVRMNATMVQSVVTYDTIIEFANPELKLFPGMTAYVTIPVATVKSALKVPNTALRYKPPMPSEEIQAIYQRYGIDGSGQRLTSADSAAAAVPPQPSAGAQASAGAQSPSRAPKSDTAVVWKFHADGTMEPVKVTIGITDHAFTEVLGVLKGELKEGDAVVIRSVVAKNQAPGKLPR
ncbi:MAG TPA: efflux RND transporter periplasmic adaptor subunit [Candidatus Dormibacteraeota bacterium]|nr:efflux RND transporter periplasmic adaptor subunit [Candidatus Dormibacteraeota bacterium]